MRDLLLAFFKQWTKRSDTKRSDTKRSDTKRSDTNNH